MQENFAHAPCVHPYNAPKYHALQLRSVTCAKAVNKKLLWVVATDWTDACAGDED